VPRLSCWFRLCLLLALAALLHPAQARLVCVIGNERVAALQEAAESLGQELVRSGMALQEIQLPGVGEVGESCTQMADAKVIISLGTDALRQALNRNTRAAIIAALIPRLSYERVLQESNHKNGMGVTALYLDQPFGRQLDLLHLALPELRRVGVLWGPESISQQALLSAALQARGLEVSEGVFSAGQPLITALRAALLDADVLLAVADGSVYNPSSVSNILLTSYRAKTPVMAFSPAYVKAGALLSVHSTAAQLGAQAAAMASQFLQSGNLPASQYPSDFSISSNAYVGHSLGLELDSNVLTERLRRLEKPERKP
jgi:ABC-type uncharacterized transport system substrate-binding protein